MAGHGVESLKASESESNDVGLLESLMEPVVKHEKKNRIGEIGLVESPTESEVEHEKKMNMIDESETKEMGLLESPVEHEKKNLKAHMIGESEIIKDFGLLESPTELEVEKELKNLILDNDSNDSTSEKESEMSSRCRCLTEIIRFKATMLEGTKSKSEIKYVNVARIDYDYDYDYEKKRKKKNDPSPSGNTFKRPATEPSRPKALPHHPMEKDTPKKSKNVAPKVPPPPRRRVRK